MVPVYIHFESRFGCKSLSTGRDSVNGESGSESRFYSRPGSDFMYFRVFVRALILSSKSDSETGYGFYLF